MRRTFIWFTGIGATVIVIGWLAQVDIRRRQDESHGPNPNYVDPGLMSQPEEPFDDVDPTDNPHWAPDLPYRSEEVDRYKKLKAFEDSLDQYLDQIQKRRPRPSEHDVDVISHRVFIVNRARESAFFDLTYEERDSVLIEPGMGEIELYAKVRAYEGSSEYESVDGFWMTLTLTERDTIAARIMRQLQARGLLRPN